MTDRLRANDWFRALLAALAALIVPWLIPGTWGFIFLLLVYGAPYSLLHSIWVRRLEWVGEPPDFAAGLILATIFYTVIFRYLARLGHVTRSYVHRRNRA
jgi:hypothetical protein